MPVNIMKQKITSLTLLLLLALGLEATAQPSAGGIVYGPKGAFNLSAPKGWKLDPTAGAGNGLPCVLYPEGTTWQTADPLMYAKVASTQYENADLFAKEAIEDMEKNRTGFKMKRVASGKTAGGEPYFINGTRLRRSTRGSSASPTSSYPRPSPTSYFPQRKNPRSRSTTVSWKRRPNQSPPWTSSFPTSQSRRNKNRGNLMIAVRISLLVGIFCCSLASESEAKRWPVGADEFSTIEIPVGFAPMRWKPPSINAAGKKAPLVLDGRFRSSDGKAEFAVAIYYVRHVPTEPDARRIAVPLARGEKIADRKTSRRKIAGEDGGADYWLHEETTTVSGLGYTRYLLNSLSTSSLPGATSDFWEFRVVDDEARKRYAIAYRKFKESLEVGED